MKGRENLLNRYARIEESLFLANSEGYWSNLDKEENAELISNLDTIGTRNAIKKYHQNLYDIIFSNKRAAGLELIDMSGDEECIDCGCMWGALTIPLAKRCKYVLGIDQTLESLKLLNARIREEQLDNVDLLCMNLKRLNEISCTFDVAIVNGVLEWIPEDGSIELKTYYGKYLKRDYKSNPYQQQRKFLVSIKKLLKDKGKLYLAIENRYDFKMFLGMADPHSNLLFTSFLPRSISNWISIWKLGRPYRTWIYSFREIYNMIKESGFSRVELYMCFPDYRYPDRIYSYSGPMKDIHLTISSRNAKGRRTVKRYLARLAEYILFKVIGARWFAPSIIAVGHK